MKREEAMEIMDKMPLCNECDRSNFPYTCVECGDAFLKAMEALRQPEIVRCKDCKYFPSDPQHEPSCWKNRRRGDDPDWFCADGEKRGGLVNDV